MRIFATAGCLVISVILATGCASTEYHYSQLMGNRYFRTPIDTYPVVILRVDGQDNIFQPALVEAGRHEITLQGPSTPAMSTGKVTTFSLDVASCTRYYIVAVKPNKLESDYTPRVDFEEPVSGCTPEKPKLPT